MCIPRVRRIGSAGWFTVIVIWGAVGAGAIAPVTAQGFEMNISSSLLPGILAPRGQSAVHEQIAADAIQETMVAPNSAMILGVQRGVENTDLTHQWDPESHFDNSATAFPEGLRTFRLAFSTIRGRMSEAERLAHQNPEFLAPDFRSFRDIIGQVAGTFGSLVTNGKCLKAWRCPTTQFAAKWVKLRALQLAYLVDPNPDPHNATSRTSLFYWPPAGRTVLAKALQGVFGGLGNMYRGGVYDVRDDVSWALGNHRGRTLVKTLGQAHPLVRALERESQEIDAYLAMQAVGHALHTTADFFAHTNYVESMAGVEPGTQIPSSVGTSAIPVPASFADFSEAGLSRLMGNRYSRLESGYVSTIWLGEGDYCLGNKEGSAFNPNFSFQIPGISIGPYKFKNVTLFSWHTHPIEIIILGHNPSTKPPFHYCHYRTSAAVGLNKDAPDSRNFAWARDAATRMSALLWKSFIATVAMERVKPPASPRIVAGPPTLTRQQSAVFSFVSGQADAQSFVCNLDSAARDGRPYYYACSSPFTVGGLQDALHLLRVEAVDSVGARSAAVTWQWRVDTTAPQTTITGGPSATTGLNTVTFAFTANEPNSSFKCTLDGVQQPCQSPITYGSLADGAHTFAVTASDPAGNIGAAASRGFTVDTRYPETIINSGPPAQTGASVATFTFSSNRPGSTFVCSLDGAATFGCNSPLTLTLGYGSHTLTVAATDPLGHTDPSPARWSWYIYPPIN